MNAAVRTASDYWTGLGIVGAGVVLVAAWRAGWLGVLLVVAAAGACFAFMGSRIDGALDAQTTTGAVIIGAVFGLLIVFQLPRRT